MITAFSQQKSQVLWCLPWLCYNVVNMPIPPCLECNTAIVIFNIYNTLAEQSTPFFAISDLTIEGLDKPSATLKQRTDSSNYSTA